MTDIDRAVAAAFSRVFIDERLAYCRSLAEVDGFAEQIAIDGRLDETARQAIATRRAELRK